MQQIDAGLERLVLAYLDKRGYAQTSRQLKVEAASSSRPMSLGPIRDSAGVSSELLFFLASEGQASHYALSFDRLASWVDSSLDKYRPELTQILYPIFLHCHLYLIKNNAVSDATQHFSRHSHRFSSIQGQPSKVRVKELNELQAATTPEHLQTNKIATAIRSKRMPITLSTYSYELLLNFLQASRLVLILGIVNDHLSMKVLNSSPKSVVDNLNETHLLAESDAHDAFSKQLPGISLGLLKNVAEDRHARQKATEAAKEAQIPDQGLTKKAQAQREKNALKEVEALEALADSRLEAEVPLPSNFEELEVQRIADLEARATLTSDALPSAVFYTFSGNIRSLNCCSVSEDCSLVAGGFESASIKLARLQQEHENRALASDIAIGNENVEFVGHSGAVYGVDIPRTHPLLLSSSADSTLRLWHTDLNTCVNLYRGHNFPVWDVKAGPLGVYFASAGADKTCRIWSVERNSAIRVLAGHQSDVECLSWHPNNHYLATGSSDTTIRLWDMRDGAAHRVLSGHRVPITALAIHPEGELLASADEDGQIIIWDLAEAKQICSSSRLSEPIWTLSYSSGQAPLLASGSANHTVELWQHGEGAEGLISLKKFSTRSAAIFTKFSARNLLVCVGEQGFQN